MKDAYLHKTVDAFNQRRYDEAALLAQKGLDAAVGRDELFWLGLLETCLGFGMIMRNNLPAAEEKLVAAIEKLRNFGFRYEELEVTSVLAGLRGGVAEIRSVRGARKRVFDVSLLPTMRLAGAEGNR